MSSLIWTLVGAVVGAPISSAASALIERTGEGVPLSTARERARAATDWRIGARLARGLRKAFPRRPRSADGNDAVSEIFLVGIAIVLVLAAYVANAIVIATILFAIAAVTLFVTIVVFTVLYFAHVYRGGRTVIEMVLTVAYAAVGVVVSVWLIEPPLHGVLGPATLSVQQQGAVGVLPFAGPVAMQVIGAVITYCLLLSAIGLCLANMSAALFASGVWGRPMWRFIFWTGRATTGRGALWVLILLGIGGVAFSSGLAFEWWLQLQLWLDALRAQ